VGTEQRLRSLRPKLAPRSESRRLRLPREICVLLGFRYGWVVAVQTSCCTAVEVTAAFRKGRCPSSMLCDLQHPFVCFSKCHRSVNSLAYVDGADKPADRDEVPDDAPPPCD
jgi:hypothetical protein